MQQHHRGEAKANSFIGGATMLALAGLIGKVIGAVYRIWLTGLIGAEGVGIYQKAYPVYAFLLVISSAGIPIAISKLVSERVSQGDERGARHVFQVAYRLLLGIGVVTSVALYLLAGLIAQAYNDPSSVWCFRLIAPSLLLVSLLSAYRGYYQGRQIMRPTAVSQVIEQIGKLAAGYVLIRLFLPYGLAWGAAGAILGITASEALALLYTMALHARYRARAGRSLHERGRMGAQTQGAKTVLKRLLAIAIPITLGASIMPLVGNIDSALVVRRLMSIGFSLSEANTQFGALTGIVNPLVNMPAVISLALSMSLVPALSAAVSAKNTALTKRTAKTGIKLAILIGLPCAAGMFALALPIVRLLFGGRESDETLRLAAGMLETMAFGVLFLTLLQATTGILQGIGRIFVPMMTLAIGAAVKIAVNYVLVGNPEIGVKGAPVGTLLCYGIAAVFNLVLALRASGAAFKPMEMLIKPLLATACMTAAVYAFISVAGEVSNTVLTLGGVAIGGLVYAAMLVLLRVLNTDEWRMLPGGSRLVKLLVKLHLLPKV